MRQVPPRLLVVPATGSPHTVVLRRGPTGHVTAPGQNRDTDAVAMGQWLKARIYEYSATCRRMAGRCSTKSTISTP